MARPKKGCPKITPLPQVTIHIERRDYDNIVYMRVYPNQPLHEIFHKVMSELASMKKEVRDMHNELDGYREFIKAEGLEEKLYNFLYKTEEAPTREEPSVRTEKEEKTNEGEYVGVVNRYPDWDV